jgi:hypothetical protein
MNENVIRWQISEKAISNIIDFLFEYKIHPRVVPEVTYDAYLLQMVECSSFWSDETRLAVGSILVEQPLKAQGAYDVKFTVFSLGEIGSADEWVVRPTFVIDLNDFGDAVLFVEPLGDWTMADVNSPAREAAERARGRGLKIEEQFVHLYAFVRGVASHGFGFSINNEFKASANQYINIDDLRIFEHRLVTKAVKALNDFEGNEGPFIINNDFTCPVCKSGGRHSPDCPTLTGKTLR